MWYVYVSTHFVLPDISNPDGLNLCESVVFHHVVKWATSNLQSSRLSPWSMEDQNHTHTSNGKNRYVHCRIVLVRSIFLEQSRLWRSWRQGSLLITYRALRFISFSTTVKIYQRNNDINNDNKLPPENLSESNILEIKEEPRKKMLPYLQILSHWVHQGTRQCF